LLARGGLPHKGKYLAWRSFEGGARWSRIFNCPLSRSAGIDYKWTGRIEVMGTPRPKELAVEGTWSVLQRIRPHTNHGVRVQGKKVRPGLHRILAVSSPLTKPPLRDCSPCADWDSGNDARRAQ